MNLFVIITGMLGGLALFLYGMKTMSEALSNMTGGGLEQTIEKITRDRFRAFLTGTGITAVVQSSSATTVLTVGLVNAGIIRLTQAVGLVIGANLGTTATAWILSLNALPGGSFLLTLCKPSTFSPYLAAVGIGLLMFARSMKKQNIGSVLIGFAVMMTGMNMMSGAAAPLQEIPFFRNMLVSFENPLLGFSFALLFTMLIQSSDATIGILQAIAVTISVTGGMAIPLVCGAQVGTCISALLSSLGTSNNGKRTALLHLYYNLFKTVPFLILFYVLNAFFRFGILEKTAGPVSIPLFHTFLNILGAVVYLPFAGLFVRLSELTIPYTAEEEEETKNNLTVLDRRFLSNPGFAAGQVKQALRIMALAVKDACDALMKVFRERKENGAEAPGESRKELITLCTRIERFEEQILKYLAIIAKNETDGKREEALQYEERTCIAFGRTGRMMRRIADIDEEVSRKNTGFSDEAVSDLLVLAESVYEVLNITIMDFGNGNRELTESIKLCRAAVSGIHGKVHERHIRRLHGGICDGKVSVPFMDICYDLMGIIDTCGDIAETITGYVVSSGRDKKAGSGGITEEKKEYIRKLYADKYELLK